MVTAKLFSNRVAPEGPPIKSVQSHLCILGSTAVLLALAFPEPGWGWLAHVALVPAVLLAPRAISMRRLVWTSYVVSLIGWLLCINWLIDVTLGGYIALSMYLAVYLPTALVVIRVTTRRWRVPLTFLLPLVWVSLETIRAFYPAGGFNWLSLGHTQAPYTAFQRAGKLIQVADLFGEQGVSFLVAMTNGLIADLLLRNWLIRHGSNTKNRPRLVLPVVACFGVWVGAWFYGSYRINQFDDSLTDLRTLRVAVIQTNVPQNNKDHPTPTQMMVNWHRLVELTRLASQEDPAVELLVWPETMVPAGLNTEAITQYKASGSGGDQFHQNIQSLARELQTHLIVGAAAYDNWKTVWSPDKQHSYQLPAKRYNTVYHYQPDGTQTPKRYDKIHRVPFGEYIPWVENIPWLKRKFIQYLSPYEVDYTLQQGQNWTVFQIPTRQAPAHGQTAIRLATPICFEDTVARVIRTMAYDSHGLKRTDILINLTNDGWYAGTDEGPQHLQNAILRCIENRLPMARSVNTGISGFIDSLGRVGPLVTVDNRHQEVDGFASHTVRIDPRTTLFGQWGHLTLLCPIGLTMLAMIFSIQQR